MTQVRVCESRPAQPPCERPSLSAPRPIDRYVPVSPVSKSPGTICVPVAAPADVPSPSETEMKIREVWNDLVGGGGRESVRTGLTIQDPLYQDYFGLPTGLNYELVPEEEIREMWNQTLKQSNEQVQKQTCQQQAGTEREKAKKLELLLMLALNSGDMDLAMLLFSSLETKQCNEISKNLLQRMQDLQAQRRQYSEQMAGLDSKKPEDAKKASDLNNKIGDVGTEIGMLQTFLQEATSHKNEAQTMASNFLKGRHEVGMSIARNIG